MPMPPRQGGRAIGVIPILRCWLDHQQGVQLMADDLLKRSEEVRDVGGSPHKILCHLLTSPWVKAT